MKINNLPDEKFKVMVIKLLTDLRRRMKEHSENFNKELQKIRTNHLPFVTIRMDLEGVMLVK